MPNENLNLVPAIRAIEKQISELNSVDENGYYEGIPFAQGHCFNWNIKDRNLKCYRKPPVSNTQEDN